MITVFRHGSYCFACLWLVPLLRFHVPFAKMSMRGHGRRRHIWCPNIIFLGGFARHLGKGRSMVLVSVPFQLM